MNYLTNQYVIAFGIPLILIVCGGVIKKIIRGTPPWEASDFFLGVELLFASFTSAIFNLIDGIRAAQVQNQIIANQPPNQLLMSAVFLSINFFMLLLVIGIHQTYSGSTSNHKNKIFFLGFVGNTIGIAILAIFYLGIKTS